MLLPALPCAAADDARAEFVRERAAIAQLEAALGMRADDVTFADAFEDGGATTLRTCTGIASDRDDDRLDDCVESGRGRFLGRHDTGTSADDPDTDGDGLLDGDEVLGTAAGLDLPALGVHPLRRNILLEYDWFDSSAECGFPTHRPTPGAIARVAQMFASAPVSNPDGSTGITVLQDYGQGGAFAGGNAITGWPARLPGTFDATHAAIKSANFDPKRAGYFHYVLMAYSYRGTTSSGYAEIVGDDLLVTLQCARSDQIAANAIAHELGHNLGLRHGGDVGCNGKPNYASIMNYAYTFSGAEAQCGSGVYAAGFSRGTRPTLDESALDETRGLCGTAPRDFDGDGTLEASLSHDLNPGHASSCGGALTTLGDFDDWSNLAWAGLLDKHGLLKDIQQETDCPPVPKA
jgi:hypothetical protein